LKSVFLPPSHACVGEAKDHGKPSFYWMISNLKEAPLQKRFLVKHS